jgi:hypothetical protein
MFWRQLVVDRQRRDTALADEFAQHRVPARQAPLHEAAPVGVDEQRWPLHAVRRVEAARHLTMRSGRERPRLRASGTEPSAEKGADPVDAGARLEDGIPVIATAPSTRNRTSPMTAAKCQGSITRPSMAAGRRTASSRIRQASRAPSGCPVSSVSSRDGPGGALGCSRDIGKAVERIALKARRSSANRRRKECLQLYHWQ